MDAAIELTWTYLQRPPQPDPPRHPTECQLRLLLLRLPASGRHYRFGGCRAPPGQSPSPASGTMSGPFPNYGSPDMMVLEGAPALSPFRRERQIGRAHV